VVVNQFELGQTFVQSNLIVPFKSHIYRTGTSLWHSFNRLIKLPVKESGLISQMTAKTEENQFVILILFLINSEHDSVGITEFTISIDSIEDTCKSFRKIAEVKCES